MDTILTQIFVDPDWEFLLLLEKGEDVPVDFPGDGKMIPDGVRPLKKWDRKP